MLAVDSSAIFAILLQEPERELFLSTILHAQPAVIGAPTLFECRIVALRRGRDGLAAQLQATLDRLAMHIDAFDHQHERIAAEAFRRYGRGLDRAGLNFGDCFSYAIAKARDVPLLFKGNDFRLTDITPAL